MTPPRTPTTAAGRAWLATPAGLIVVGMRDAILAIEAEALAEPGPELTMKEKGWREAAFQVGYNRGADEARASLDEPPRIVTLAWDATAEDVARIRRDWEAAAEARAPLDVERLAVVAAARALRERLTIDPGNVVSWGEWDTLDEALAKLGAKP